jgi:hypothetical protein
MISAICNAVNDTLWHHYSSSIFKNLNSKFWKPQESWLNKYKDRTPSKGRKKWLFGLINKPVQVTDAFHGIKTIRIVFSIFAISIGYAALPIIIPELFFYLGSAFMYKVVITICLLVILGVARNLCFTLFYHHLLIDKNSK